MFYNFLKIKYFFCEVFQSFIVNRRSDKNASPKPLYFKNHRAKKSTLLIQARYLKQFHYHMTVSTLIKTIRHSIFAREKGYLWKWSSQGPAFCWVIAYTMIRPVSAFHHFNIILFFIKLINIFIESTLFFKGASSFP